MSCISRTSACGKIWQVCYAGVEVEVPHTPGMQVIRRLLSSPAASLAKSDSHAERPAASAGPAVITDAGAQAPPVAPEDERLALRPRWNEDSGDLYLGQDVVAHFRRQWKGTIRLILIAFEESGWRRAVDWPLPGQRNAIPTAVSTLNKKIHRDDFRFRVRGKKIIVAY